jgi:phage terminase large subunit-like protein
MPTVAERPRRRRQPPPKDRRPWWGDGAPPHERWPGVSLTFPATWSTARDRWETHDGRYYFDAAAAARACDFFPLYLQHHIGEFAGTPFALRDDQDQLLVRPIFGWKQTTNGTRRFRKLFAFCPKGYGKSPLGAGLAIYLARCDQEPAAEVYAVAADREQARIVHSNAKVMVEQSPDLQEGAEILRDAIVWPQIHATLKVLSSDASTKHGFRPHAVVFDELHAQKNRDLYEALIKSMVKRRSPLMIIITHAGSDDEGICFEEYDLAKRVLAGQVALETTLPVIFEMQPSDDWTDPAVWQRVNPGHGTTVKHDAIVQACQEALAEPRKRNDFLRYHGNRWTSQATAWIPIEWWDACQRPFMDAELATFDCAAGLDLAQKWDLACFCVIFRRVLEAPLPVEIQAEETGGAVVTKTIALNFELFVRPFFWIPENTLRQHAREDGVPYPVWVDQGLVTATDGDIIDYTRIYQDITTKILPRFPRLKTGTIGYDPAFATDLSTKLRDLAGLPILEVLQNYTMLSEPSQIVEALIKGRRVHQDGHRVLRWCWENVAVKTDEAGRIRPIKPRNPAKRIDGAVAMILGVKALMASTHAEPTFQMLFFGRPRR